MFRSCIVSIITLLVPATLWAQDSQPTQSAPDAYVHCYSGASTGATPDGSTFPMGMVAARRTVDPSASQILEEVMAWGGEEPAQLYIVQIGVQGEALTLQFVQGGEGFVGTGHVTGTPWLWDVQYTETVMPDGTTITSDDHYSPDFATLAVDKAIIVEGITVLTMREEYTEVPCAEWEANRDAIITN